ncbi:MAG: hypothetical protein EPN85_04115 [Bacteroidetes bacterium]|nr:MAG: hypothetical protein EPN85_04115 [Bacteroidota bacterium]
MKVSSLQEVKRELQEIPPRELLELCISLAKYKKDNKEYLAYLLFQSHDRNAFILQIKAETDELFVELKTQENMYHIKKGLRRILRIINKYCKYLGNKAGSAEVHLHFCQKIKEAGIPIHKSARLVNLFHAQEKKIRSLISTLHEDLQADYLKEVGAIFC